MFDDISQFQHTVCCLLADSTGFFFSGVCISATRCMFTAYDKHPTFPDWLKCRAYVTFFEFATIVVSINKASQRNPIVCGCIVCPFPVCLFMFSMLIYLSSYLLVIIRSFLLFSVLLLSPSPFPFFPFCLF